MHVKLVVNSFPAASETFLFNLVTGLENRGVKVTVCASKKSNDLHLYTHRLDEWSGNIEYISPRPDSLQKLAYSFFLMISKPALLVKFIGEKGLKKGWRHFITVWYLSKSSPDIIHFSFSEIGLRHLYCLKYLKRKSIKLVVSCRGTAEKIKPLVEPDVKEKLNILFLEADLIHCVSKNMRDGLKAFGLQEKKAFVNYPSIKTNKFLKGIQKSSSPGTGWHIVTVGRLCFQKGYAYALQALKILADMNIRFTYHIVGDGPDSEMLTFLIQELGLNDSVVLYGKVSSEKVTEILRNANVFLLPSLSEGVSNAALEAMAMELPVVSAKVGGMSEIICHGENGLLTDWRNPQHMAEQLLWLHQNPCRGIEMGKKARLVIESSFSLDRQIDIFISKYNTLLNG